MRAGRAVLIAWALGGGACRNFGEPPLPRLAVTPPALTLTGLAGGVGPPRQGLTVDAIGVGRLTWTAHANVPWLSVTPTSAGAPAVAWVTALPAGLTAGGYAGTITVATTSGWPTEAVVPVTLTLTSVVSLTGRWAAGDTVLALTLIQTDTVVAGEGTLRPLTRVSVAGFVRTSSVALTLRAADSTVTTFAGSLVDENTVRGTLNGGPLANHPLTLFRQ